MKENNVSVYNTQLLICGTGSLPINLSMSRGLAATQEPSHYLQTVQSPLHERIGDDFNIKHNRA